MLTMRRSLLGQAIILGACVLVLTLLSLSTSSGQTLNLALNKPATTSSMQQDSQTYKPAHAVDGNLSTRWASAYSDPQWLAVDLGATYNISRVVLNWHSQYALAYQIQVSNDGASWTSIYATTSGDGGIDDLGGLTGSGRYIRMYGTQRSNRFSYSLWELEVYGGGGATSTPTPPPPTGTALPPPTAGPSPTPASSSGVLFDDFSYAGPGDPALSALSWTLRAEAGGPGVAGASWSPNNISFVSDPVNPSNRLMQMQSSTAGSGATTSQTEMFLPRKFFEGTYASRVRFSDGPLSGPDGDNIVQTFFTITPLAYDLDPNYGEIDFEYLPNGGWGAQGPIMYLTTWETYRAAPWRAVNASSSIGGSFEGWHTLIVQVAGGQVKYYIDGVLRATHTGKYYPETPMSINYNLWFIEGGLVASSTPRAYVEQVDWLYFANGAALSPAQVDAAVASYKAQSVARVDTLP